MTTGIAWGHLASTLEGRVKIAQLLHLRPELRDEERRYREAKEQMLEGLMDDQRLKELEER